MSVKIQVNSPPVVPRVLCDPALLELVLENLASNAFDAIRSIRNPEVTVTIQYPAPSLGEDGLAVLMQDNGPGLPESVRGALRPGGSAADVARQAGLGLAIVRALLDTAGGQLAVLDGAAMQAAGLTVELPIAKTRNQ
jgi:C4-dicarboxylate-specific signal transduction histidine kinase